MPSPRLISSSQAATILGISQRQISRRVHTGQLTPQQQLPGRRGAYLFNEEEIRALAAAEVRS